MQAFKTLLFVGVILCTTLLLSAQKSGLITYSEVTKLELEGIEGLNLKDMMPSEMGASKALYFNQLTTVYRDADDHVNEDIEMESDDGSFQMVFSTGSAIEEILYTDLNERKSLHQTEFMGKEFLITSDIEKAKWKITDERIKYLDFVCQKAVRTETIPPTPGTDGEPKEREIVAWFTPEIPLPIGPDNYGQLPGAVLLVSVDEGKTEIKATAVDLEVDIAERLTAPTKGQKVSPEEYDQIIADKMKELQESYNNKEGASFIIRG